MIHWTLFEQTGLLFGTKRDLLLIERLKEKRSLPVIGIKNAKKIKKVETKMKSENFFLEKKTMRPKVAIKSLRNCFFQNLIKK